MERNIHEFENGVRVFEDHILPVQRLRYARRNVHEEQEEGVFLAILDALPRGAVFVNIGTAIGYYALLAKRKRPDLVVYCVEPLPQHVLFFKENISLNGFRGEDFVLIRKALAPYAGSVLFEESDYSSRVLDGGSKAGPRSGVLSLPSITLLQICEEVGRTIGLVQMDIQGGELAVLSDYARAVKTKASPIAEFLIGTHGSVMHDRCQALLVELHYRITYSDSSPAGQPDGILAGKLRREPHDAKMD